MRLEYAPMTIATGASAASPNQVCCSNWRESTASCCASRILSATHGRTHLRPAQRDADRSFSIGLTIARMPRTVVSQTAKSGGNHFGGGGKMKSELGGYVQSYLREAEAICKKLSQPEIERIVEGLVQLRADGGRLFILGVGGSAANASHAVNDFRKIANIESYTPTDNVSELTARINDDGWDQSYVRWLMGSRLRRDDAVLVFSVGGGDAERHVSNNVVESLRLAREVGAKIYGIVGRDGGFTAKVADACVIVPTVNSKTVTPHTEAFQAVVWHLIVSHPALAANEMKWESLR